MVNLAHLFFSVCGKPYGAFRTENMGLLGITLDGCVSEK
jgi:hypothetical protein